MGINPGYVAAETGRYYAGPGNHFWKCLLQSGLIPEPMSSVDDFRLPEFGIGMTNIVARTTRSSADLKPEEIRQGKTILDEKLAKYRPKIVVFNGKEIYRVYSGKKDFKFGRQPNCVPDTDSDLFVMPSSSARCSQLPRAEDKLPYYRALKKLLDFKKGLLTVLDDADVTFDSELKTSPRKTNGISQV